MYLDFPYFTILILDFFARDPFKNFISAQNFHSGLPPPTRPLTLYIFRRSRFQVLPFIFLLKSSCVTKDVLKCLPFRNILANVLDALKLGDVIAKNCSYVCTTLWL